jgi:hypothetical protein
VQDEKRRATRLQAYPGDHGATGAHLAPDENADCGVMDGGGRVRLSRHAPPEDKSGNESKPRILHDPAMAWRKSRIAHPGCGKGEACAAQYATCVLPGTRGMAQPEDSRVEELLCDAIQREVDGQVRLVHSDEADEMVCKEAPAKKLAQFRI